MLIQDRRTYEEYRDSMLFIIEKLGKFAEFTIAKFIRRM
jgi:hypothetical protein